MSFVPIHFVISELLSEVGSRVGHGLVRDVCASPALFRQFFTIARTRDTHWHLIYPFPRLSSCDTVVCTDMVEEIMADLAWISAMFIVYVHCLAF